jgi:hypothetical protein
VQDPPKFTQIGIFGLKIYVTSGNPDCKNLTSCNGAPSIAKFITQRLLKQSFDHWGQRFNHFRFNSAECHRQVSTYSVLPIFWLLHRGLNVGLKNKTQFWNWQSIFYIFGLSQFENRILFKEPDSAVYGCHTEIKDLKEVHIYKTQLDENPLETKASSNIVRHTRSFAANDKFFCTIKWVSLDMSADMTPKFVFVLFYPDAFMHRIILYLDLRYLWVQGRLRLRPFPPRVTLHFSCHKVLYDFSPLEKQ